MVGDIKYDFKLGEVIVQLVQFSAIDSKDVSTGKIVDFGNKIRTETIPEVLKLAKLFLFIPAINATVIIFCNETLRLGLG